MPLNLNGIATASREAKPISLSSPDSGAVTPGANLTPTSEVTDGVANIAPVPKGTNRDLSREAETKTLCSAIYLHCKAKNKAPQRAKSEVTITSLPKSSSAKLAPYGRATQLTSPSEVNMTDKVILKSPKNRSFKARGLQPKQSLQVSKQDGVSLVNTDLREFQTNKQKLELLHTSPSCCEQVGCQLVTVHSVHCRLRLVSATLPVRQSVFDRLSVRAPIKHHKKSKLQNLPDLPSASVNMIGKGREPLRSRQGQRDTNSPSFSSPDPDYRPGLGQVLVGEEGVF